MAAAVGLRGDFTAAAVRRLAHGSRDAGQVRRLLSLAAIYGGGSRSAAALVGGVGLQTVRDWVLRFNRDGPDGLIDGKAPGGRPRLDASQRAALAAAVERGPIPAAHAVVRWRLVDLVQWVHVWTAPAAQELCAAMSTGRVHRQCQEFRVRGGIKGKKETPYGTTQSPVQGGDKTSHRSAGVLLSAAE